MKPKLCNWLLKRQDQIYCTFGEFFVIADASYFLSFNNKFRCAVIWIYVSKYLNLYGWVDNNGDRRVYGADAWIFLFDQAFVDNKFVDVNPETMALYPGQAK